MRSAVAVLLLAAFAAPAAAQQAAPEPGPAQERLAYFVGDWQFEGTSEPGPMGAGGPIRNTEKCEWFGNGFHVVCNSKGTNPRGESMAHAVMSYDPARQTYTYYAVSGFGDNFHVRGTVDGDTWKWEDEMVVEGKPFKFRVTVVERSPTQYGFTMEGSYDGSPWAVMESGTATKLQ